MASHLQFSVFIFSLQQVFTSYLDYWDWTWWAAWWLRFMMTLITCQLIFPPFSHAFLISSLWHSEHIWVNSTWKIKMNLPTPQEIFKSSCEVEDFVCHLSPRFVQQLFFQILDRGFNGFSTSNVLKLYLFFQWNMRLESFVSSTATWVYTPWTKLC